MLLSLRKNGLTSLFKEARVFKVWGFRKVPDILTHSTSDSWACPFSSFFCCWRWGADSLLGESCTKGMAPRKDQPGYLNPPKPYTKHTTVIVIHYGGSISPKKGPGALLGADFWEVDPTKHFSLKKKGFQ